MPSIILPASLTELDSISSFAKKNVPHGSESIFPHVELAVEDLLVNIVMYAYANGPGVIKVSCRTVHMDGREFFCLTMKDTGRPFNPFTEAPQPDIKSPLEKRPQGGLGVYLIKQIASHYSYSGSDGSNTIELYFALP